MNLKMHYQQASGAVSGNPTGTIDRGAEPIAIIGMGMRLPGNVSTSQEFWKLLMSKKCTSREVPGSRYNIDGFWDGHNSPGTVKGRYGHFLDCDIDKIDTSFFSVTTKEVDKIDPQQRLLLEVVYECMENAGQQNWRGRNIGCYVGNFGEDWLDLAGKDPQNVGRHRLLGYGDFVTSNRVSYEFDLRGPSMTIRTACSSSLIGLHEACNAIYAGQCDSAIVAGTALQLTPTMTIWLTESGVQSPTGSCKSFDANADGYCRGEAVNAVYIKKLSDAVRDGDPIRAVIRGTAVGFDGKTKGMPNPSPTSQEALIRQAYRDAGIDDFSQTGFFECHGTGTKVGDPIETGAVGKVFGEKGIFITSVKPNVGHSEGAAGLTSLIKAVLALEHHTIPPNVNFTEGNPKIKWEQHKLKVPVNATPWPKDRLGRVSVNCFGIGGANAHAIIDAAKPYLPPPAPCAVMKPPLPDLQLLVFSAHHQDSLKKQTTKMLRYAQTHPERLPDLAYTLAAHRERLPSRSFTIVDDTIADGTWPSQIVPAVKTTKKPVLNFVFTGQGAQWAGMGADLIDAYPVFRDTIQELDRDLQSLDDGPSWTIEEELRKPPGKSGIMQPRFSQPLCIALQIALVNLLASWQVMPSAVVGHSSGEIAAAYACGSITKRMAIIAAYYRGLVAQTEGRTGGMAAVGLGASEVAEYLRPGVVVACENSPKSVTLSGDEEQLDEVVAKIKADKPDAFARRLKVERAWHSHHMKRIGPSYQRKLEGHIEYRPPQIPFFSSVTSWKVDHKRGDLGPAYWRENLESKVQFSSAVELMLTSNTEDALLLEIGPHSALSGPIRDIVRMMELTEVEGTPPYVSTLKRNENGVKSMLTTLGRLFQEDVEFDVAAITDSTTILTDLPNYSWLHQNTHWNESRVMRNWRLRQHSFHELLGLRLLESDDLEPAWRSLIRLEDIPWARDHKIQDDMILPGAAYITMAVEAVSQISTQGFDGVSFRQVDIKAAMVLQEGEPVEVVTHLRPVRLTSSLNSAWHEFSVSSYQANTWVRHCVGQVKAGRDGNMPIEDLESPQTRKVSEQAWYSALDKVGYNYGPKFQGLSGITAQPGCSQASAHIIDADRDPKRQYRVHPSIIDFGLQMFTVALSEGLSRRLHGLSIPTYIDRLFVGTASSSMKVGATARASGAGAIKGSSTIMANGEVVLNMRDVNFTPLGTGENKNEVIPAAQLHWKPDIDFIPPSELIRPVGGARDATEKLDRLALFCVLEMLSRVDGIETTAYLAQFRRWMRAHRDQALSGQLELSDSRRIAQLDSEARCEELEALKRELAETSACEPGKAITRLVDSAKDIFEGGEVKARQVLNVSEGLETLYNFLNLRCDYSPYLSLLGHKLPTMKILEIGSGAPSMIAEMLRGLIAADGEATFQRYVYTDSTSDTFELLQERLKANKNVEFRTLDVSKDFTEQGFDMDSFDLVVFSNVLHPGTTLQQTLKRIRRVTKPNGRLIMQVLSSRYKSLKFITGFLPGGSEQISLSKVEWDIELRDAGFSGTDAYIHDDEQLYQVNAHLVSTALAQEPPSSAVTLLVGSEHSVTDHLKNILSARGFQVAVSTLDDGPPAEGDIISLLDLDQPFFQSMSAAQLVKMQSYLGKVGSQKLLWLTGRAQVKCTQPDYAATIGVLRTIRTEMFLSCATVEADLYNLDLQKLVAVFESFRARSPGGDLDPDWEYAIADGNVLIPRYEWIDMSQGRREAIGDGARTLEIGRLGQIKSLQWAESDLEPLKPDEVEVEPRAVGLNVKDILVAMRVVTGHKPGFGIECAGVVRNVGHDVKEFTVGDRVMVFGHGCFTTSLVCPADLVAKIPQGLDFEQAATIPAVYSTAIHGLLNLGDLDDSQTVLIHSACGGVGLAALNICKMIGAEIFATVGTEEKVQYLMDNYGLPRDHIFSSRDPSFYDDLMAATDNRGVDIVLNSLRGELLHTSWKCVAKFGKMLEIGKQDLVGQAKLGMSGFEANRTFCGIDMSLLAAERPRACKKVLKQCLQLFGEGGVKAITPVTRFPATKIVDAFKFMSEGKHLGKVVVTMPQDPTDLQLASKAQDVKFKADASYVLIGGLGGLGCAVSNWMVENGARHLLFMSRRAGESERERLFIKELESQGCEVQIYKGDVTKLEQVTSMVANAARPVAGVLHMPMVLKDQTLLQLSHEAWFAAVKPKVDGAKNLHAALQGSSLDFFIMFSSISYVVGQAGQANYAAANAYLAAFAQYRHSFGLPASVLNVAVMGDVGYVVENQAVLDTFKAMSFHVCKETDLLDSLTFQMTTQLPAPTASGTFVNTTELALGLKSTKPLGDRQNRAPWRRDARMAAAHLKDPASAQGASNEDISSFLSAVSANPAVLDQPDSLEFLTRQIGECIYNLMSKPLDEMDEKASLASLGVDSLITIEILNWWRHTLGLSSSVLEIMSAGSIAKLGSMAAKMLKEEHTGAART